MWILIISILAFIIIMFIINFIDKNKEKLIEKFKIEKKEIMKCPHCFNEYNNLELHFCKHCNTSLNREIKYNIPKELKKKIIYAILGIILIIIIGISTYLGITNYIKEQKRIEKYNNDLLICYEVIKNELNFDKFTSIIKEHTEETDFSAEAYKKLYQALDERIENIKNGNDDKELIKMIKNIKDKDSSNVNIANRYFKADGYSYINQANKCIQEQKYVEAYNSFGNAISINKDKNQDIVEIATNKQNEIKEQMLQQVISQAQEKINNKDYSSAQTLLGKYKDFGNQTIVDMYNNATNEVNRIEAEKKAQEEAERKAREKKEAEERAKREAEEKARKKSQGVRIGMTKQEVLDSSWGEPYDINTSIGSWGVHEQWCYEGYNYLYFENGILTSIQN